MSSEIKIHQEIISKIETTPKNEQSTFTLQPISLFVGPKIPDGGYGWVIVFATFCNNMIADGLMFSFGIIYLDLIKYYNQSHFVTSILLSLFNGIPLFVAPVTSMLIEKFSCRKIAVFGAWLTHLGFLTSSFIHDFKLIFFTIGILAPIGLSCLYLTSIVMVSRYFDKKRALATGISVSGSGMGAIVFAPLIVFLNANYSLNGSLLILSAIILNGCAFGLLLKPIDKYIIDETKAALFQKIYNQYVIETAVINQKRNTTSDLKEIKTDSTITEKIISQKESSNLIKTYSNSVKTFSSDSILIDIPVSVTSSISASMKDSDSSTSTTHFAKQSIIIQGIEPYIPQDRRAIFGHRTQGKLLHVTMETNWESKECKKLTHKLVADSKFHAKYWISLLKKREGASLNPFKLAYFFLDGLFDLSLLKRYEFLLYLINNCLIYASYPVGYNQFPLYAEENGILHVEYLTTTIGICNCIGQIVLGFIADFPFIQSILLYGVTLAITSLTFLMMSLLNRYYCVFWIFSILFGLTISASFSLCSVILVDIYGIELLTNTYGFVLFFQGIGCFIGPPIIGKLRDIYGSFQLGFLSSSIFIAVSIVIIIPVIVQTNHKMMTYIKQRRNKKYQITEK